MSLLRSLLVRRLLLASSDSGNSLILSVHWRPSSEQDLPSAVVPETSRAKRRARTDVTEDWSSLPASLTGGPE